VKHENEKQKMISRGGWREYKEKEKKTHCLTTKRRGEAVSTDQA
jgi:hypothetical protein